MNTKLPNMDAQPGVRESVESLIAYCRENSRVCPMPQWWSALGIVAKSRAYRRRLATAAAFDSLRMGRDARHGKNVSFD